MTITPRHFIVLGLAALLAGCAMGPRYKRAAVETPPQYKEISGWKRAEPGAVDDQGLSWSLYKDPLLDDLEAQVIVSNQNLKAAEAAYRQARATLAETRASLFPTLSAGLSGERTSGNSRSNVSLTGNPTVSSSARNQYDLSGEASWEIDVWGRIRRSIEASRAEANASAADLAEARLSAQAALASAYMSLRMADDQDRVLKTLVDAQARALQIAKNRYGVGVAGEADILSAKTQLEGTQAQEVNIGATRASLEHAIAVLVGKPPASFSIDAAELALAVPEIPVGLPSELLERRPDISAAERRMAAANANIGVAETAFFPSLTLTGSGDYISRSFGTLLSAANPAWGLGASAAQTIFTGGARIAELHGARASYDQAVATYRQTVLTAFQQVEDNLSSGQTLARQAEIEDARVSDARNAERIVLNEYKAGTADFTAVITAQSQRLNAEIERLSVIQSRLTTSVSLIQALGGGWTAPATPGHVASNRL